MPIYYLTHVGGLESIVADELTEQLPDACCLRTEFSRLHLQFDGDPQQLFALRTIENVYVRVLQMSDVRSDPQWLDELEAAMAATDFAPALQALRRQRPVPDPPTFRVTCERLGKHDFRSQEAAGAAGAGVEAATGWKVDLRGYDVEVRLDIRGDKALVGLRLSGVALHKRSRIVHPRVAINATVAAAMVRLSQPQSGETVCDPMLGGGTILTERYACGRDVTLLGGDLFAEKLDLARQNFVGLEVPVQLAQWDARRLPLREACIDKFICNPPWGSLLSGKELNRQAYPWVLGHLRRCLKPGGIIVLLTSERTLVRRLVDHYRDLSLLRAYRLSLGGLHPSIHVIKKEP
ncbi:MAG: THUMP domain-containing protein [Armatimonadota bacterium]